jgi:DNA-binding CsgD family transcriptional regulator
MTGAIAAMHLADLACERGDFATGIASARRSLAIAHELEHMLGMLSSVVTIAVIACRLGNTERATRLLASADAVREDAGYALGIVGTDEYRKIRGKLRHDLGPVAFDAIWRAGQALPLIEAVYEASDLLDRLESIERARLKADSRVSEHSDLTAREREVLLLIADGKSNQEIADVLHISLRTAQTHVANILGKLDLNSRAAVAAFAVRHGLV